jgi:hypothetical protein
MKTNQVMTVNFVQGAIAIGHKNMVANLGDVFKVGNKYRILNGLAPANISAFTSRAATAEFVKAVADKTGLAVGDLLYSTKERGKGQPTKVLAHLYVLIYAAEFLSPAFHVEVIDTFINSKLLTYRDESGDAFKKLMEVIKETAEPILGKPAHQGHYTTISKIIMGRFPAALDWNIATAEQLKERARIEEAVTTAIRMGFIKDWEHLKQVVVEI